MEFVWFILIGLVAGWLAGQFMKGELTLEQSYQFISGTLKNGNQLTPIANGKVKGDQILFNAGGVLYVGQVSGDSMQGTLSIGGDWTAMRSN